MTTVDYNKIEFTFPLDDHGEHNCTFSHYGRVVDEETEADILGGERDFLGMIINLSNHSLSYKIEGETRKVLAKGHYNFFFIPKGSSRWMLASGMNSLVCLECDGVFLAQFIGEVQILEDFLACVSSNEPTRLTKADLSLPPEMLDSLGAMMRVHNLTKIARETFLSSKLKNIIAVGLQNSQSKSGRTISESDALELRRLYNYMVNNLRFLADTRPLLSKTKMSVRQLNKKFKQMFGKSMNEVLRCERLKKAENLLLNSNMSIGDIAAQVGYSSSAPFVSAFKVHYGLYPKEFRDKHSNKGRY